MMIDDDTATADYDELMHLCKWLNEKRDVEVSSRLIPLDGKGQIPWAKTRSHPIAAIVVPNDFHYLEPTGVNTCSETRQK